MTATRIAPRVGALPLVLALTFATGVVDAVGYLGLDRVFVGNMTGNVVILGMALTGADGLPVLGPVLALVGFAVGAACGGLATTAKGWTRRTSAMMVVTGLVEAVTAALLLALTDPPTLVALGVTTALGWAMGLQASAARAVGVKDVTTVVVTSTITGLFSDIRRGAGSWGDAGRRASAVLLMLLGALAGAALLLVHPGAGLGVAAAITLAVGLLGLVPARGAAVR